MAGAAGSVRSGAAPVLTGAPTEILRRWHHSGAAAADVAGLHSGPGPRGVDFRLLGPLQAIGPAAPSSWGAPPTGDARHAAPAGEPGRLARPPDRRRVGGTPPRSAVTTIRGYLSHLRDALGSGVVVTERPGYGPSSIPTRSMRSGSSAWSSRAAAPATLSPRPASWPRRSSSGGARRWRVRRPAGRGALRPAAGGAAADRGGGLHEAELAWAATRSWSPGLQAAVAEQPLRERVAAADARLLPLRPPGEALRAYQDVRAVLGDELGLEPGPELVALEAAILDQRPELLGGENGAPEGRSAAAAGGRGERRSFPVGRAAPGAGRARCRPPCGPAGAGGLALVTGDAGIGKSHLVGELAAAAAADGIRVAWGHCHERADAPPFWPWTEALRSVRPAAVATGGLATLRRPRRPSRPREPASGSSTRWRSPWPTRPSPPAGSSSCSKTCSGPTGARCCCSSWSPGGGPRTGPPGGDRPPGDTAAGGLGVADPLPAAGRPCGRRRRPLGGRQTPDLAADPEEGPPGCTAAAEVTRSSSRASPARRTHGGDWTGTSAPRPPTGPAPVRRAAGEARRAPAGGRGDGTAFLSSRPSPR